MSETLSIFITGAGTGIGKDTAIELVRRGHQVVASVETEFQKEKLILYCREYGFNMDVIKMDITDAEDRQKIREYDPDILINNAGMGESGSLAEIDMDKVRRNFEVNVFCALELTQLALKKMMAKKKGTVLFVSSLAGRITMPFLAPYCMTKFALSSGVETLRGELHRVYKDIHISLIEPGAYATGFNQKNISKKYEWMTPDSPFYSMIDQLKREEKLQFRLTESKSTRSIVRKIVKAAEAGSPRLRYSAPWWQAAGVWLLRVFGR